MDRAFDVCLGSIPDSRLKPVPSILLNAKEPGPRKVYPKERAGPTVFLRFARFRFKEGKEGEGLRILRLHAGAIRSAPGCVDAWVGAGQHPTTECVVIALFENEDSLRNLEGRLRSDPQRGGDFFALLPLTTHPPEIVQYEIRAPN